MNSKLATLLPLILLATPLHAQAPNWTVQLGSTGLDNARSLAPDGAGGVFVGGTTEAGLTMPAQGGPDAWVARYDKDGGLLWLEQVGSLGVDEVWASACDHAGGVVVAGSTTGDLGGTNAGLSDAWIARYDGIGNLLWTRQLGSNGNDRAQGLACGPSGELFVVGLTEGTLGSSSAGGQDAWVARYDNSGNQLWLQQIGTPALDHACAVETDGVGGLFIAGATGGDSLGGVRKGSGANLGSSA